MLPAQSGSDTGMEESWTRDATGIEGSDICLSPQFPTKIAKSPNSIQEAQMPESRKVGRGMQRKSSDIGLSKQFPIYISANGRRLENMVTITLPELEIGPWYQEKEQIGAKSSCSCVKPI